MEKLFNVGSYKGLETRALTGYHVGENGWFPPHPDCPNHKARTPVGFSFSDQDPTKQVSCADCFLHSTILQSMNVTCPHLHACSDCTSCYSHNSNQQEGSPPLFSCQTPPQTGISSPLIHQDPSNTEYTYHEQTQYHLNPKDSVVLRRNINDEEEQMKYRINYPELHLNHSHVQLPPRLPSSHLHVSSPQQTFLQELHTPERASPSNNAGISLITPSFKISSKPPKQENRKRGANDVCDVCGDRASGYHYNALTCEGCKGFFRRTIQRKEPLFRCKFGGNCEMDTYTRRKCPECRLKKCKAVGMLEECLLTEIQCQSKRNRKRRLKQLHSSGVSSKTDNFVQGERPKSNNSAFKKQSYPDPTIGVEMSNEEKKLVCCVTNAFAEYAMNPELEKKWSSYFNGSNTNVSTNLSELATSHVKLLVEFTKKLPGFTRIKAEDQIDLIKGSVVEMMLLRNAHSYNRRRRDVDLSLVAKDTGIHEEQFRNLLNFFEKAGKLNMDNTEYGLLCSIILFDCDHATSNDRPRIDRYRDMYLTVIKTYCEARMPQRTQAVAKILNLITELRTLYSTHTKMVSNFRKRGKLTPLLCEIWDLK